MNSRSFLLVLGLVFAGNAFSQTIYSTSFEATSWSTSSSNPFLANNWDRPSGSASQFVLVGPSSSPPAITSNGTQSVRFSLGAGNVTNYSVQSPNGISAIWSSTNRGLRATTKLFIDGTNSGTGRYFGLGVGNTVKIVVNTAGTVKIAPTTGIFGSPLAGASVANRWIDISLTVDFVAGLAYGSVDGRDFLVSNSIGTAGTVNNFYLWSRGDENSVGNPGNGRAYFDEFVANPVPEPASMAVLGLGALGLVRRRRASK